MASITVSVKATNGDKHAVETEKGATVLEFKEAVASKAGVAAGQQRLIYKGASFVCQTGGPRPFACTCPLSTGGMKAPYFATASRL